MKLLERFNVWRRRRKVKKGYLKIAEAEVEKSHGFTPLMSAWSLMERDGYIELNDGEVEWKWP